MYSAREFAEEKLLLLRQEEKNLADRFEALSAEALRKSNQAFLELAKTQLDSFQQGARGDLDQRQQALAEHDGHHDSDVARRPGAVAGDRDDAEHAEKQRQRDADLPAIEQPVGQCDTRGGGH